MTLGQFGLICTSFFWKNFHIRILNNTKKQHTVKMSSRSSCTSLKKSKTKISLECTLYFRPHLQQVQQQMDYNFCHFQQIECLEMQSNHQKNGVAKPALCFFKGYNNKRMELFHFFIQGV